MYSRFAVWRKEALGTVTHPRKPNPRGLPTLRVTMRFVCVQKDVPNGEHLTGRGSMCCKCAPYFFFKLLAPAGLGTDAVQKLHVLW
jgi:hypothetical protein